MIIMYYGFFFQAEDGIRDLVRSRGLGDVYKRQAVGDLVDVLLGLPERVPGVVELEGRVVGHETLVPVSYTHLTLPTSDLV